MVCEKCWAAAYTRSLANGLPQYENYLALLAERDGTECLAAAANEPSVRPRAPGAPTPTED
jgi:hypothetical protein